MDYLIPTLSKDFQGVIPRPSTSDRGLRWLKEALVRQGVDQDLVTHLLPGTLSGSSFLPTGDSQGPEPIPGELADRIHSGYLYQGEKERSG